MNNLGQEVEQACAALCNDERFYLIGVRHHSAALAANMRTLLESANPAALYIEMPPELEPWLQYLGHRQTQAPIVLAATREGRESAFYPFADFSPELAALRWAIEHQRDVFAIDAPYACEFEAHEAKPEAKERTPIDHAAFWDTHVEARAAHSSADALRRAALMVGYTLRRDEHLNKGVSSRDLVRESFMRERLRTAPKKSAVIVGAFHASALASESLLFDGTRAERLRVSTMRSDAKVSVSMIPYQNELFDLRSGYPAGVRDPRFQQEMFEALCAGTSEEVVPKAIADITRAMREQGHNASVSDAIECTRMASDLARLRGLRTPGRREMLESVESTMAQGQREGRGRALARVLSKRLVGERKGVLAPHTPRSGLSVFMDEHFKALRLEHIDEKVLRLDPHRSLLDKKRHIAFCQMQALQIRFAERLTTGDEGRERIGQAWSLKRSPATDATVELAGLYGVRLHDACAGFLSHKWRKLEEASALTPKAMLELIAEAAECAVLVQEPGLEKTKPLHLAKLLASDFGDAASFGELTNALVLVERIQKGLVFGTSEAALDITSLRQKVVAQFEGLWGSQNHIDIQAIIEVSRLLHESGQRELLHGALLQMKAKGTPLVRGAAYALLAFYDESHSLAFSTWLASQVTEHQHFKEVLWGALKASRTLLDADPQILGPLQKRIESVSDEVFLTCAAGLRAGFDALSPLARQRLLDDVGDRFSRDVRDANAMFWSPIELEWYAQADRKAAEAVSARLGAFKDRFTPRVVEGAIKDVNEKKREHAIDAFDRWRLILGRERQALKATDARRAARALDELYGRGRGEGAREDVGAGEGRGFARAREWTGELEALFGARVRDEILAQALSRGRSAALFETDPASIRPDIAMLTQVLSLAGSLGEGQLVRLRKVVSRIVEALTKALAQRVVPAMQGAYVPRPTRRRTGRLDLLRTVQKNLGRVQKHDEGHRLVAQDLIFKSGSQKTIDWQLSLVVDISGSMEASVIYSAMMAAILSGAPWLDVSFYAFNTEVIDLSERVSDPLSLLLEVKVGGGTDIAKAMRFARQQSKVPKRTMVIVVSDFEEGGPLSALLAEVRALKNNGAKVLGVAALNDHGGARYNKNIAGKVAGAGMPVASLSPLELARWVADQVRQA